MLKERLSEWTKNVLAAYEEISNHENEAVFINTFQMVLDVDKIIAEEFDHNPVFLTNYHK